MSVHAMLEDVKKSLRPDGSLITHRDEVVNYLNAEFDKRGIQAHAFPGGSTAKNTYLAGDHDIDIFARFALTYANAEENLSDLLEPCLKRFKPERIHGSRDYFQFAYEDFDFEIIPVLAVDNHTQAQNITDMSPLHVLYFEKNNQAQEDEVRLAKQFCKAAGVYGAESYVRGFSGHVVDLLILHYNTFYDFVRHAAKWEDPVIIDLEKHHTDVLVAIDKSRHSPLILVDPVQPDRNAAAALGKESFEHFVTCCQEFVKNPSAEFFLIPTFSEDQLRAHLAQQPGKGIVLHVTHDATDKKDVAGAKVRKAFERLERAFADADFTLVEQGWHFEYCGKSVFWFLTEEHSLAHLAEHRGPPISAGSDAQRFCEQHEQVEERDGRLYTKVERKATRPIHVPELVKKDIEQHIGVTLHFSEYAPPMVE